MGSANQVSGNKVLKKINPKKKKNQEKSPEFCEHEVKSKTFSMHFNINWPFFVMVVNILCSHVLFTKIGLLSGDVFV